jgi:hypothetical protein
MTKVKLFVIRVTALMVGEKQPLSTVSGRVVVVVVVRISLQTFILLLRPMMADGPSLQLYI